MSRPLQHARLPSSGHPRGHTAPRKHHEGSMRDGGRRMRGAGPVIRRVPPGTTLRNLPAIFATWTDKEFEQGYINAMVSIVADAQFHGEPIPSEGFAVALTYLKQRYRRFRPLRPAPKWQRQDIRGERHDQARLTATFVRILRGLPGTTNWTELASAMGVSRGTIEAARSGRSWRHVPRPGAIPLLKSRVPT